MITALYAGSFDPFTNGHLDILRQSAKVFDRVVVGVAKNTSKKGFLPLEVRSDLIKKSLTEMNNVGVSVYDGLTVNYAKEIGADVLVRGLRNSVDFEYENSVAGVNRELNPDIRTVFFVPDSKNLAVSSSIVRELFYNKVDISKFVPKPVSDYLKTMQ